MGGNFGSRFGGGELVLSMVRGDDNNKQEENDSNDEDDNGSVRPLR